MEQKKIIYLAPDPLSPFVQKDIQLLSNQLEVIPFSTKWLGNQKILSYLFKEFFFLAKNFRKIEGIYVMFAGYWAVLPVIFAQLFNLRCIIILGGTDCVSFPKLDYGNLRKPFLKRIIQFCLENASALAPVHESLVKSEYRYDTTFASFQSQGFKTFFPTIETKTVTVYNGFDPEYFKYNKQNKKAAFVSVATIGDDYRYLLKGGKNILDLAMAMPECEFCLIGLKKHYIPKLGTIPSNLNIIPYVANHELPALISSYQFYLQLSISEGFPNSLCEAMLCECIPIVSNVGAMPFIVENIGLVLHSEKIEIQIPAIRTFMANVPKDLGIMARNRVIEKFTLTKRQEGLTSLLC